MNKTILLLTVLTAIFIIGCSKSKDIPDNIASQVSGTYYGDYNYSGGSVSDATVILSRLNDSTVNLAATVSGSHLYTYPVRVQPDQYGKIALHFENFNVQLFGVIDGNDLAYTHNYNYFTGTKP